MGTGIEPYPGFLVAPGVAVGFIGLTFMLPPRPPPPVCGDGEGLMIGLAQEYFF